ncbi:hypothetical protein ACLOJK_011466 [Asimina triloba]
MLCYYLIHISNLEDGLVIKEGVLEEAIPYEESKLLAFGNGSIKVNKLFDQLEVMVADAIAQAYTAATDGLGVNMELDTQMVQLEHVLVWVYDLPHPHVVVGTMDHMNTLQRIHPQWIVIWVLKPEIITISQLIKPSTYSMFGCPQIEKYFLPTLPNEIW